MNDTKRFRVGIDIGGTFTDFILFDQTQSTIRLHKCLTTPKDPSSGAISGLQELLAMTNVVAAEVSEIVHGTTLVTNAVIERKGARIGLLTTKGFRDVLETGTEQRYDIYDLFLTFPEPLAKRSHRIELPERMGADGDVIQALDEAAVVQAVESLVADGVLAVAVCFMHSYRNPAHEIRARDIVKKRFPELSVSISSEVVAEISEFQRFSTTCSNAYVQPLMSRYLRRFEEELSSLGFVGDFRMMHSAGGLVSVAEARDFPIRLLESGPAGGALATGWFSKAANCDDVIAFDMGGTTAKTCLIENGRPHIASFLEAGRERRFKNGSGLPIRAPVVDMIEIGAGGGSIAWIDEVGLLQVGPDSAGSEPGPASYGRGGTEPTVTDASVALGYYDPTFFLGGRMKLERDAADKALAGIADPLGISTTEAAWGIHKVVGESMANATRIHLVEKGKDPRAYSMIGFGGAGPAFAARVARILGIPEVIIPPASGAASAFGFLTAPLSCELVRSRPVELTTETDPVVFDHIFRELEEEGYSKLAAAGVKEGDASGERSADMRLVGQVHEITVPIPNGDLNVDIHAQIRKSFQAVYSARYAHVPENAQMEILSFRVRVSGPTPELSVKQASPTSGRRKGSSQKGVRKCYFGDEFVDTGIYDRIELIEGDKIVGPAIIEEPESTTVVPPEDVVTVDAAGNLHIAIATHSKSHRQEESKAEQSEQIRRIEADPITLEIMWSRLVTIAEEMWLTVCRTAYSIIISESQDFGCAILDVNGDTLAHSARVMPVFNNTMPIVAKALLKRYPVETLEPGDVLICNDPWLCAGHSDDIAVITPVFKEGKVIAVMATVGHVGDIGGIRDKTSATELYDEGLQIPAMKLFKAGVENEDLIRLVATNVRGSDEVIGDIRSLVAANETGSRRLLAFMDEYGLDDIVALGTVIHSRSEKAMRRAILEIPDGTYSSSITFNPLGQKITFAVQITVSGDEVEIDYKGAPSQVDLGGINCTLSYTTAHSTYPLKCMLTPAVRGNAGCYRPIKVKAPEGSILNCVRPAPVSLRIRTGWYLSPNIYRALSGVIPDKVVAHTALPSTIVIFAKTEDGSAYHDHFMSGGGQGGSAIKDGKSGLLFPTSAATSSIELLESRTPILILEKGFVQDSGGAGEFRGGLAVRIRLAKRYPDAARFTVILSPEGVDSHITGLFGGESGLTAHGAVSDSSSGAARNVGTGGAVVIDRIEQVVELQIGGGSGFGKPGNRDQRKIEQDIREGYVSEAVAAKVYGFSLATSVLT